MSVYLPAKTQKQRVTWELPVTYTINNFYFELLWNTWGKSICWIFLLGWTMWKHKQWWHYIVSMSFHCSSFVEGTGEWVTPATAIASAEFAKSGQNQIRQHCVGTFYWQCRLSALLFSSCHFASCHFLFHPQFTSVLWNFGAMRNECMNFAVVWLRWKNGLLRASVANKMDFSAENFELQSCLLQQSRHISHLNLVIFTHGWKWIIFLLSCRRENRGPTKVVGYFFCTDWTSKRCRKLDYRFLDSLISWFICWTAWISLPKSLNFPFSRPSHFSETNSTLQTDHQQLFLYFICASGNTLAQCNG